MSKHVDEIRTLIVKTIPLKDPKFLARYVGSVDHDDRNPDERSQLQFLGLTLPQVRALAKAEYKFTERSQAEQLEIWLKLYHSSKIHDELCLALIWMSEPTRRKMLLEDPQALWSLQNPVDNWALSDQVSEFVSALLETAPELHLPQMKKWNQSSNPWERRQSLVGLYCYARKRKRMLPAKVTLPFVENLLNDPHYFVQKAVGWCLREIHHVDPEAQVKFVTRHLMRLSSAAFSTAIEKYSQTDKSRLKRTRVAKKRTASKKKKPTAKP